MADVSSNPDFELINSETQTISAQKKNCTHSDYCHYLDFKDGCAQTDTCGVDFT